jgi:hypothetical protein
MKPSWILLALLLVVIVAVVSYRPDRPVPTIAPGSSSGPAFVVQIIRPRLGLPFGGILPPQIFGLEGHLGFDSQPAGARTGKVGPGHLEFGADDRDAVLVFDTEGPGGSRDPGGLRVPVRRRTPEGAVPARRSCRRHGEHHHPDRFR